ncbi:MAG: hypothetical protein IJH39_09840 [Clostridia bacterium]|nr:hypothetical protein [Clostridia bacterium]
MDERISVSYDASAFMREIPYQIISRNTTENLGAKVLNNYGNDTIHVMVADEGRKLLSTAEDEFIRQLKEEYAEAETPVYVNGILLKDWKESDKVIKA